MAEPTNYEISHTSVTGVSNVFLKGLDIANDGIWNLLTTNPTVKEAYMHVLAGDTNGAIAGGIVAAGQKALGVVSRIASNG